MKYKTKYLLFCCIFISIFSQAQTPENKIYNLFLQKQYEKAISTIEETDILTAADFYYAGLCAEAIEDAPLASFYFKKSIAIDTLFVPAQISLAQACFQNEEYVGAIEIYAKLLETDTLNAFLWGGLGDSYAKMMLLPQAYSCYENAFYLNPKNSANTLKLVSVLGVLKSKDYMEESLFYCDSSLTYNENYKPLLRKKAVLLFTDHEYLQAAPILKQLLSLGDSTLLTLKYAGICNALQKKHDLAIVLLRKAHKQSRNDMEVMLHLASSLSSKPEYFDETLEVIAEIRKNIEPDSAIIYHTCTLLAETYLGVKDTLNAVRQYYASMNVENKDDRLLRMTNLANKVKPETSNTLLWYVHYYFLQNFEQVSEDHWNYTYQKEFSQSLLRKYIEYMHMAGKQKVIWNTFTKKTITLTMKDLQKLVK